MAVRTPGMNLNSIISAKRVFLGGRCELIQHPPVYRARATKLQRADLFATLRIVGGLADGVIVRREVGSGKEQWL